MPWSPTSQEIGQLKTDLKQKGIVEQAMDGWITLLKDATGKKQAFALISGVADYPELKLLKAYGFAKIGGNSKGLIEGALKNAAPSIAAATAQSKLNDKINEIRKDISGTHEVHLAGTFVDVPISRNIDGTSEDIAKKYYNGESILPDTGTFYIE